jgi:hypothetical protein
MCQLSSVPTPFLRKINAFVPEYWAGEIYHDADKAFYRAFGQGELRTASSLALLNPLNPAWGRILAARCACVSVHEQSQPTAAFSWIAAQQDRQRRCREARLPHACMGV